MSTSFNPYHVWLGLADCVTQPNYFELLGLEETEDNAKTIAAAADRVASRVRRCRPGEHANEWAALLDQISVVKQCLTDPGLRSEYLRSLRGTQKGSSRSPAPSNNASLPAGHTVDPNMYPPGLAPAMAPVSHSPVAGAPGAASRDGRQSGNSRSANSPVFPGYSAPLAEASPADKPLSPSSPYMPADPQAAVPIPSYPAAGALPMSPAGVPYLQPVDQAGLADPMRPAMHGNPYAHVTSPMAPAPIDYGAAMAAVPAAGYPMAAIPVAIPGGSATIPTAQALPLGATMYPMAVANSALSEVAARQFGDSALAIDHSPTGMLPARRSLGGLFGPVTLGLAAGLVLLAIGGGYLYLNSTRDSSDSHQVASSNPLPDGDEPASLEKLIPNQRGESPTTPIEHEVNRSAGRETSPAAAKLPDSDESLTDKPRVTKAAESTSAAEVKPSSSEPSPTDKPTEPPKPDAKVTPDSKPAPDSKTIPAADAPEKTEELPKPTKEELTKLERAMQKAREAIGAHEFDRAEAFISVASEMPRLPEHQSMLDRLKLLSKSVSDYRQAIQASIGKLAVASSFDVGEETVIVVETGPEKVIFRMKGQNRAYTIRELPVGLAVALAAQTLADDDPNTLTLKGAYIMASPRASQKDLEKAREALEKASGSIDAAKELLRLFEDKYDLAGGAEK